MRAGVPNAEISVVSQDTGFRRSLESGNDGSFQAGGLEPGAYKITVQKEGFKAMQVFDLELKAAGARRIDFPLEVGSVHETVYVSAVTSPVDRQDAATGGVFTARDLAHLPLNGGGLLDVLELVPGANVVPATRGDPGQFTAAGQRPNTNIFTIDGVSANTGVAAGGLPAQASGGTLPAASAFGSLDPLITLNAIDEVHAQTSTTVAQFGRMPGANVGLTSQSGANQFHGQTEYRNRESFLGANDWFGNRAGIPLQTESLNEFTQTLGGPVRRNSTYFYFAYQAMRLQEPFLETLAVPDSFARTQTGTWDQAAVNFFPLPNQGYLAPGAGQWTGVTDEPATLQSGSARIDQSLGSRVNLFARYSDTPSANAYGNLSINYLNLRSQSLTLGVTARPFSRLTFDARINESQTSVQSAWDIPAAGAQASCALEPLATGINYGGPCSTVIRFSIDGVGQLESGDEGLHRQRQFQTVDSAAIRIAHHAIVAGIDYRRVTAIRRDAAPSVQAIASGVNDLFDVAHIWRINSPAMSETTGLTEYSLWAQDTWQVVPRLTLTYGLRWEFSPPPDVAGPINIFNPATGIVDNTNAPLWPTSFHDLAPRVAMALRLSKDGNTVLRAGAGLYYDSSLSIATDVLDGGPFNFTCGPTSGPPTSTCGLSNSVRAPFPFLFAYGFTNGLKLPQVRQWNISVERAFTPHDFFSLGYVGSDGRELVRREVDGPGSLASLWFALDTNNGFSNYQALQFQYRRQLSAGWQASAAYTWSHSIDNGSSDSSLQWAGPGASSNFDFGNSDFDLRHVFTGSLSYQFGRGRLQGWRIESIARARSGFPIGVLDSQQYTGLAFANFPRPNYLGGPVWLSNPLAPGGKQLNTAAFQVLPGSAQGNLGRNAFSGFGMWQADAAIGKEFAIRERSRLDFRLEAFNVFNHPNFADPVRYLDAPLFGQSTSMLNLQLGNGSPGSGLAPLLQSGGPRLFQGTVRFWF